MSTDLSEPTPATPSSGPPACAPAGAAPRRSTRFSPTHLLIPMVICLLLALAQIAIAGYALGVGNQSIQMAFLEHAANPAFYTDDAMVAVTQPEYPTYFFRLLAPFLHYVDVEPLYVSLQIATAFAALLMVYALSQSVLKSRAAALAAVAILVPGHLHALAGAALYSPGFTHTFVALPLALGALVLGFRGRWFWAFGIAALLFNIHALTAAFALLMLSAGLLAEFPRMQRRDWIARAVLCGALAFALASPTLALMFSGRQAYGAEWISLMRIRSADHSFPSAWWTTSDPDLPQFALLFALFAIALSFAPRRVRLAGAGLDGAANGREDRPVFAMMLLMVGALLVLFAAGFVFTDVVPVPLMIRLQPFRASRLFLVLMLVYIAHGAVRSIALGVRRGGGGGDGRPLLLRAAEIFTGVLILATLMIPPLLVLLPVAVLAALVMATVAGRLSWRQSGVCAAALLVALLASRQIDFSLFPTRMADFSFRAAAAMDTGTAGRLFGPAVAAILAAAALAGGAAIFRHRMARRVLTGMIGLVSLILTGVLYSDLRGQALTADAFADAAHWADTYTPVNTLFLAPADAGNFRVASERSVVADWRDGTQLYFSSDFAPTWFDRMTALKPGLALTPDGRHLLSPGENLSALTDQDILKLAQQYQVDYILLPNPPPDRPRSFPVAFAGKSYTVYRPEIDIGKLPDGVINAALWKQGEEFMNTTVKDNIEKYRKTDLTVQIVDASGRPIQSLPVKLDQTKQAFVFGCSLGFFEPNNISVPGDERGPNVKPVELQKLPELFNGSMIAFSGKWAFIEPTRGEEHWSDLDKYVDYCTKNDITMEYHHLTGTLPPWVRVLDGGRQGAEVGLSFPPVKPELQAEFTRHCLDVVSRYAGRIKYFQVVNEKYLMEYVPPVFKMLQEKFPNNKFGLSDCVRFWDGRYNGAGNPTMEEYKGVDAIDWLKSQGITPDFFSLHGHYPMGLWADPQEMYSVLNYFQDKGIRVHLSEEYLSIGGAVYGPMRTGSWTPQMEADYLCRYLTIAFSHPDVDMVNLWGMTPGWDGVNTGVLDDKGQPRPAWDALKKLFTQTWRSHVSAVTGLDGGVSARVFQGTYTVNVSLNDGKKLEATIVVPQKPSAMVRFRLTPDETLEPVP